MSKAVMLEPIGGGNVQYEYKEIVLSEDAETLTVVFDNELPQAFGVMIATKDYINEIGTSYTQHRTIAQACTFSGLFASGTSLTPVLATNGTVSRWDRGGFADINRNANSVTFRHESGSPQVFKAGWKYYAILC